MQETFDLINGFKVNNQGENERAINLIGTTGCGKSTLALFLCDKLLIAKENAYHYIVIEAEDENQTGGVVISHSNKAETKMPIKVYQVKHKVVVWDNPGFSDNRGISQELANAYYSATLLETTQQFHYVLVISEHSLYDRGTKCLSIIKQFADICKDINSLEGSCSLFVLHPNSLQKDCSGFKIQSLKSH